MSAPGGHTAVGAGAAFETLQVSEAVPGPLRAAVIGAGAISKEHLTFLHSSRRAHLAGVCDVSRALAEYAASTYHAEKAYTDAAAMLKEAAPDVVHVLTPPHTHESIAIACLDAGAHVVVEKPMAPTLDEFERLCRHAESRGKLLVEDHNYRFNDETQWLVALAEAGRLGDIVEVEIRMNLDLTRPGSPFSDTNMRNPVHDLPAGAIHDLLPHLCYLCLLFMPRIESARARWERFTEHPHLKFTDLDAALFGGGVFGRIRFTSRAWPDSFSLIVRGTGGWAETDLFQPYRRLTAPRPGPAQLASLGNFFANGLSIGYAGISGFLNKVRQKTPYHGMQVFLDRTYAALQEGTALPVSIDDMRDTAELIDALLAEENRL